MMKHDDILGLAPYHAGAGLIVNAGAICMLAFAMLDVPYPWIGFFVGAVPVFVVLVRAMERENKLDANHDAKGNGDA